MKQFLTRFLMIVLLAALSPSILHAQATRTWVSGVGDDANPGSRTAPCKTFAGAISKTAPGGEIDALDPGGFGAVTITKSITLDGGGGQVASILVSGTNGIVINAASTDVVIIRNLRFQGLGPGSAGQGLSGINVIKCGAVIIQNCDIDNFSVDGIHFDQGTFTGSLSVFNTRIVNVTHDGVFVHGAFPMHTTISDCEIDTAKNAAFEVQTGVQLITNTVADNCATCFLASNGGAIHATHCQTTGDATVINPLAASTVVVSDCDFIANTKVINAGGGAALTFGNNRFVGNTTNGVFTSAALTQM